MEAAASPLPSEDTTPPVTKMYFADIRFLCFGDCAAGNCAPHPPIFGEPCAPACQRDQGGARRGARSIMTGNASGGKARLPPQLRQQNGRAGGPGIVLQPCHEVLRRNLPDDATAVQAAVIAIRSRTAERGCAVEIAIAVENYAAGGITPVPAAREVVQSGVGPATA